MTRESENGGARTRAARVRARAARLAEQVRAGDRNPVLLDRLRRLREHLPGDALFGDPLSTTGPGSPAVAARLLSQLGLSDDRASREAGLAALQVWQSAFGRRDRLADRDVTLLFTDLVGFSSWALRAGDEPALALLRRYTSEVEPEVGRHGGTMVKRLGDGTMAVFAEAPPALEAVTAMRARLAAVEVAGHRPLLRAGMHTGRPARVGSDWLGVDVNIAARLAEKAGDDELLVSATTLALLDRDRVTARRRRTLPLRSAKGIPDHLAVWSVEPR